MPDEQKTEQDKAHSAYEVWLVYCFRAIEKILPALKGKTKYGWLPGLGLALLVLLALTGLGIYLDGYYIHPPAQYEGVCASPAEILRGNCVSLSVTTISTSNVVKTVTITQQAGQILNATRGG